MTLCAVVTGASGFVGRVLSSAIIEQGGHVIGLVRQPRTTVDGVEECVMSAPDFADLDACWPRDRQCDAVIHLAARVHMMRDTAADPFATYRETNVEGSLRIARAAHAAGARRMVFVSSIKALGDSDGGRPLRESDEPRPTDPYGISKLEAEQALRSYGQQTGLEIVIVRPPLVYGPGVRANFLQLVRALAKGVPLPLGAIAARRSMVFVENLASALAECATNPRAAGETFHVADSDDLSVTELARILADQLGAPRRLVPVPAPWLRLAGKLTGRSDQIERLIGSLQLDSSRICEVLNWRPPYTIEQGLSKTASWYRSSH
ncbi:NAD-dependent epimerase/dehydratase family protein [Paraburkholderia hospita]|uniref:NAD-dependent epimerase/dehydratase family protein n=1 Tax=Paraburkholderia hospita TaxID=169430 RepID=UPI0009A7C2C6|nr:NAD-dependent epimerase/dehydratase family protein [Paraburkholderia hospita]SKC63828.1 Nucleoside-diphosphate-sugar epimerase [Paraburkholderia hospita]